MNSKENNETLLEAESVLDDVDVLTLVEDDLPDWFEANDRARKVAKQLSSCVGGLNQLEIDTGFAECRFVEVYWHSVEAGMLNVVRISRQLPLATAGRIRGSRRSKGSLELSSIDTSVLGGCADVVEREGFRLVGADELGVVLSSERRAQVASYGVETVFDALFVEY